MPYRSKAEQERGLWLTLNEAIALVQSRDKCEDEEAWGQLKLALGDGALRWKWNGPGTAKTATPSRLRLLSGRRKKQISTWQAHLRQLRLLYDSRFWAKARACFDGEGAVLDDAGMWCPDLSLHSMLKAGKVTYRPVLILVEDMDTCWPTSTSPTSTVAPPKATASKAQIRKSLIDIYAEATGRGEPGPNVNAAYVSIRRQPGVRRARVREVLKEEQFKSKRRPPGKR